MIEWFKESLRGFISPRTNLFGYISNKIESGDINKQNMLNLLKEADFEIIDIDIQEGEKEISEDAINFLSKRFPVSLERIDEMKKTGKISGKEVFLKHSIVEEANAVGYSLHYREESQGTQRYYQFSGLLDLMFRNQVIFSIDELESSLHPDLIKLFLLTFLVNVKASQLIFTTHFRELLLEEDIFRNDVIWFTDKLKDGSTDLFSLADFDIDKMDSLYHKYKLGKYGGTPDLGTHYIYMENGKKEK